MNRWILGAACGFVLSTVGCDGGKEAATDTTAKPEASGAVATAAASAADTGGAPVAVTPGNITSADQIPTIPGDRSAPPSLPEWNEATQINTQGAGGQPGDCYMKLVREWLKVHCSGDVTGIKDMEGFGNKGSDYFEFIEMGKLADFIVRLRKGQSMKVKVLRKDQDAALFVSWPPSSEKPLHVALGIGRR